MRRILWTLGLALLCAAPLAAQTADPCGTTTATSDSVFSGRPYSVTWKLPATMLANDGSQLPAKYDGFMLAVDGAAATEALPKPVPVVCADGMQGYKFTMATGVPKGAHSVVVHFYFVDAAGVRQEGAPATRPFVASDPVPVGPFGAPSNLRVWPK